jgi:hypothetical protein
MDIFDTVNTTRIPTSDPVELSVYASRMLWPKKDSPQAPKVIILAAPKSTFPFAYMAASLVHDPIEGNELLMPLDELPEITADEIRRLDPEGAAGLPPVILVGPFARTAVEQVEDLGYDTLVINGRNVYDTAAAVARLRKEIIPESVDGPISLFVVSTANPFEGMAVPYYSTHTGVPILFTGPDRLPRPTAEALREMKDNFVYVVGNKRAVSDNVVREIDRIVDPPVRRIAGRNPFATAVRFAAYHDPETELGWNRNIKGRGDAFTYCNIDRWDLAMAGAGLAHHGKHTPLLLVERDCLPDVVRDYLEFLRPLHRTPPMPPFMHGFIPGTRREISSEVQAEIDAVTLMEHDMEEDAEMEDHNHD